MLQVATLAAQYVCDVSAPFRFTTFGNRFFEPDPDDERMDMVLVHAWENSGGKSVETAFQRLRERLIFCGTIFEERSGRRGYKRK